MRECERAGCSNRLSRYNKQRTCHACQLVETETYIECARKSADVRKESVWDTLKPFITRPITGRELHQLTGLTVSSIYRVLQTRVLAGVLVTDRSGPAIVYTMADA